MIKIKGYSASIELTNNKSLTEELKEKNIYISNPCGGKGICGKCKIRVLSGDVPVSDADRRLLTDDEIDKGIRIACHIRDDYEAEIELLNGEEHIKVLGMPDVAAGSEICNECADELGIAVDIGTTTLVAAIYDMKTGSIISSVSSVNHQRSYGADVISRIDAANNGSAGELNRIIKRDLLYLCDDLICKTNAVKEAVSKIMISGNTTMVHLLMGYPCKDLGVYPFTPWNVNTIKGTADNVIDVSLGNIPTVIIPGISAFVGGDIVSGLLSVGMDKSDKVVALIDLGTNGEMAVGNKDKILVTSAAAGPAFEGGNISCGVASVDGAVCKVLLDEAKTHIETIGDVSPVGICGTGVIELVSELLKNGIIDETGLYRDEYENTGFCFAVSKDGSELYFTQKDVRELQLAKAAIRAGFETLLQRYGITADELDTVYLSGGFGYSLNGKKAVDIGLLPVEVLNKIIGAGNASLNGAIKCLLDNVNIARTEEIVKKSFEIHLAKDELFNDIYINSMMFN